MIKKAAIGLVVIIVLYVGGSYFFGSEESKIRDIIEDATRAVNNESVGDLFSDVALEFQDASGIKYLPARYIMTNFFNQTDNVNLRVEIASVNINGKESTAELNLILSGSKGGNSYHILGEPDNPTIIVLRLKKGITGWKIHRTENIKPSREFISGKSN
ncbi:MAG: hypothetical protein JW737_03465 [Acidobacteria bacterium]|nr:hypothetical protein [Acidobacteriota bacterium]